MTAPLAPDTAPEPRPAPAGAAAVSGDRAAALVGQVLRMQGELALTDAQVIDISRLYWSNDAGLREQAAARLTEILTAEQFRQAVTGFFAADGPGAPAGGATPGADPAEPSHDRDLLELDVATKAADRLIGWMKLFGVVIAAPTAVVLFGLSVFGISKFEDVRTAASKADVVLTQARATLSDVQGKVADLGTRTAQVDAQLAELSTRIGANDSKLQSIGSTVQEIAKTLKFESSDNLTDEMRMNINKEFAEITKNFRDLGYKGDNKEVSISVTDDTDPGPGTWTTSSIEVGKEYAKSDEIWLHWLCVIVLEHSNPHTVHSFIVSSLAFYFLASFRDEPRFQVLWHEKFGPKTVREDLGTIVNVATLGANDLKPDILETWTTNGVAFCGVLWDIRKALGHQAADKLIYDTLRRLNPSQQNAVVEFLTAVLANARASGAGDAVLKVLRDRGIGPATLR